MNSTEFSDPFALAMIAQITLLASEMPAGCSELTDGSTIWYSWDGDMRARGTRVFRALASIVVGPGARSTTEVGVLAMRLAAPPLLMRRVGLLATIGGQRWMNEAHIRTWWRMWEPTT